MRNIKNGEFQIKMMGFILTLNLLNYTYSVWNIALFMVIPPIIAPFIVYSIIHNYAHLKHYKKLFIFLIWLASGIFYISLSYYNQVIRFFLKLPASYWYPPLLELNSYLILATMVITFSFMVKIFGKNWLMRRKHYFHENYGPYLVMTSEPHNSIKICGHFSVVIRNSMKKHPEENYIEYWKQKEDLIEGQIKRQVISIGKRGFWNAKISGLQSNTRYFYQIKGIALKSKVKYSFHTASEPMISRSKNFLVVGDMHASGWDVSWLVNSIKNNHLNSPFIVSCGDNVSDGRNLTHWKTFFNQIKEISPSIPFACCTGNHDAINTPMVNYWKTIYPHDFPNTHDGLYHSIIYEDVSLIFLDNYQNGRNTLQYSEEQLKWLDKTLAELPQSINYRFIITHESFYSTSSHGFNKILEEQLNPILKKYRIDAVINGHNHLFELFYKNDYSNRIGTPNHRGTSFITTGGAGGQIERAMFRKHFNNPPYFWEGPVHEAKKRFFSQGKLNGQRNDGVVKNYQEIAFCEYHYLNIVLENQKIRYQVIGKEGKLLYEFEQFSKS